MRLINADTVDNYIVEHVDLKDVPTVDAVMIPKNATNGDMIKAIFPSMEVKEETIKSTLSNQNILIGYEVFLYIRKPRKEGEFGYGTRMKFSKEWWNAPYEKEVKSENGNQSDGCMCYSCKKIITDGRIFPFMTNPKKGLCFECY